MKLGDLMPPELVLKAILVTGGAFRANYECLDEGTKERYFFVLNREPSKDDTVIMVTSTTQVQKRIDHHRGRAGLVLVTVEPSEYPDLPKKSVLDCEASLVKRPRATFEAQSRAKEYKPLPALPDSVMVRILAAVSQSRTLSAAEKTLILKLDTI